MTRAAKAEVVALQTRFCEQHSYEAGHTGGDQADIRARSAAFVREQILRPQGY